MRESVIVGGARTPFGKLGGALKGYSAAELGGIALAGAIGRSGLKADDVEAVVMGMALQAGAGQVPSRQAARAAGLDWRVTTETVNKACASGLRAIALADTMIRAEEADVVAAGGMESMSNAPYLLPDARWGARMGDRPAVDAMLRDGLTCAFDRVHMIVHGSLVAAEYGITREAQDEWALRSHVRAVRAREQGYFAEEIVPVGSFVQDEAPRPDASLAKLATLPPLHLADGTVTAGNAPGVNDGAAALVVMSRERAAGLGIRPLATIVGHASVGEPSRYIATTPALAIRKLLSRTAVGLDQIARFEVNEAFAAVALTSGKLLGWNPDLANANGGAIALGHPLGASGARILHALVNELRRIGGGYGVAAICSGAAQGDAVLVRVDG